MPKSTQACCVILWNGKSCSNVATRVVKETGEGGPNPIFFCINHWRSFFPERNRGLNDCQGENGALNV